MIYGSVCSGIEAATVAWHPLGWRPAFYSEIEAFPRAVLAHHYPHVPCHGDFTTIEADDYGAIDLLVAGTPCQEFSVAAALHEFRLGLAGDRGNLTLEFVRLASRKKPRWLLWENVPGVLSIDGGRAFGALLGALAKLGYGFAYRILDAQFTGLAQRRERVFVVAHLGNWRRAAAVLLEPESLRWTPPPQREAQADVAPTLPARTRSGGGFGTDAELDGLVVRAFGGNNTAGAIDVATACNAHGVRQDFETETFIAYGAERVRRLTPLEWERLQGFPEGYTDIPWKRRNWTPDGPRYRALGNSMPVPVMRWIGERIAMVERLSREVAA